MISGNLNSGGSTSVQACSENRVFLSMLRSIGAILRVSERGVRKLKT